MANVGEVKNSIDVRNAADINNTADIKNVDVKSAVDVNNAIDVNNAVDVNNTADVKNITDIKSTIDVKNADSKKEEYKTSPLVPFTDSMIECRETYYVGYWYSKYTPAEQGIPLPTPIANETKFELLELFWKKLEEIELNIESYGGYRTSFWGGSSCRICEKNVGGEEFSIPFRDKFLSWPIGYKHYHLHNIVSLELCS